MPEPRTDRRKATDPSWIEQTLGRADRFVSQQVWRTPPGRMSRLRAAFYRVIRVAFLAVRGLIKNDCLTRASGLTYVTVLALVPMLALAFSVAKGFGAYEYLVENTVEPFLDRAFGDLPAAQSTGALDLKDDSDQPEVRIVVSQVLDFVADSNFKNLGLFGLAFLLFTAIKLMTSIETVFNQIWGAKQSRSFVRRVTDYVAILFVTPMALLAASGITAAARSNDAIAWATETLHLQWLVEVLFRLVPLVTLWIGFGFLYITVPNTRVRFLPSLSGGIVGGSLWWVFQFLHVEFQLGVARYNAIYSGFAAVPIFLVWVYFGWVSILLGAQVAWAHQSEPHFREEMQDIPRTVGEREILSLRAAVAIVDAFLTGDRVETTNTLAARYAVPPLAVADALRPLVHAGVLARTEEDEGNGWVPARDPGRIDVQTILETVRGCPAPPADGSGDVVDEIVRDLREELKHSPCNLTLRDLVARARGERRERAEAAERRSLSRQAP